ncbi:tryptophan halogenase family protein [Rhodopirellula halodulae]|uniref:tryptophan halogenase family protein n=1 Tax=Rhodopirellula halodulae TaxID=2894198 RepID=UPI001E40715D|nr:tryptophan halogenase family protein [Rhodopirellula sp. JC737]MCC9657042.1 tryptophan 7-halogenase [Rhodopirellula sp. JC737]
MTHSADCPSDGQLRIVVVGGGTAGWMSAATLKRRLKCHVTVIESDRVPSIGVGEATIPAIVDWIENMGVAEDEFIRRTGATYKLAIRFDNWVEPTHRYWHPFGICGSPIDGLDLIHTWRRGVRQGWLPADSKYTDFSFQRELCELGRGPREAGQPSLAHNYAFHLDAGKLATFLQEIAVAEGVNHIIGDVCGANLDACGDIQSLTLNEQSAVAAELFIDCSGFAGALIQKVMRSEWVDWSDQLICDRAITMRRPQVQICQGEKSHEDGPVVLPPYTISTGMKSGWSWQIPLHQTTGCGYVFSSAHLSDEEARDELIGLAGGDFDTTETKVVPMRVGMRPESWVGNCVSIGLSAGFVEPLESTGIFLVQRALDEFVECLPTTGNNLSFVDSCDTRSFNQRMTEVYHQVRDFVLMHYVVSRRRDTPFWREAATVLIPESLQLLLEEYTSTGRVRLPERDPTFLDVNHHYILSPAGIHPGRVPGHPEPDTARTQQQAAFLQHIQSTHTDIASKLPSHRSLMDAIHL